MAELQPIIIHSLSRALFFVSLIAFPSFSLAWSTPQGKNVPFITGDIEQVSGRSFDYIIVGGGACGCPLAATLSEKYSVLLVERGGSPYGNPLVEDVTYYAYSFFQTDEFTSVAQQFISEDGVYNYRGRALGGSTTINGAFYSRASQDFIEKAGWDKELVREAYEWVEPKVAFQPNPLTRFESTMKDAMLEAGFQPFNGFSFEHIKGTKIGASIYDNNGTRHTAADLLAAGNAKNITVLLNATVQNVIFHDNGDGKKLRASGIRFIKSTGNPNHFYEAYISHPNGSSSGGDVILSAGALGSPQLLMLSGIGPREHLQQFNITPLIDAKEVGQSMQDNPLLRYGFNVTANVTEKLRPNPIQVVGIAENFQHIVQGQAVPYMSNLSTTGVLTATGVLSKITYPLSRGSLKLNSTDPRLNPLVRFNYLAEARDMDSCVEMAELIEKVALTKSVETFAGIQQSRIANDSVSRDEALRDYCKNNVGTYYHYHGGCVVGSVVDKDYRVFGVEGLRVVDGSTLVSSPGTNPMATMLMLGRYQGIKMLRERKDD